MTKRAILYRVTYKDQWDEISVPLSSNYTKEWIDADQTERGALIAKRRFKRDTLQNPCIANKLICTEYLGIATTGA